MPTSEARIIANRQNASHSTGPRTDEGKAASRQNGLKHGLTGAGVVIPAEDKAEVDVRADRFRRDLKPADSIAQVMVYRLAVMAVRMERCVEYETATLHDKVCEVMNDPDIETEAERRHAIALAKFDHSPESASIRRYEAASSREFFKTLRALECHEPSDNIHEQPLAVASSSLSRSVSAELASSCKTTVAPVVNDPSPAKSMISPPADVLNDFDRAFLREMNERSKARDPLHFAIGKPPGAPG